MKYSGKTGEGAGDSTNDNMEFPLTNLYELDSRVFQDNWSIPYKRCGWKLKDLFDLLIA